ncbi:adenosine 5'-monophosphoramidase HINT3-like [Toxorhynchites rutilus septentrionalis]|uniref:adenosine 5'-monophosphoramidase HINT3-like n=1 Tax=Toxorhynchites rutilus septentrionalis TaxID=329112 RepID=UPI00247AF0D1|nr:adenosine 5'-monophosphoramidase HINT3-like [Toxorhynchites rutilus septentrionalis]
MTSKQLLERCVFCNIVSGKDPNAVMLFDNERICIFKDIRPAANYHLLAVPKYHINDTRSLTVDDRPLLEEMRTELGNVLTSKHQIDLATVIFGFHIPPFTTVKHLHMHGIAPASSMGFISRMIFKPNTMWFNTVQAVLERLPPTEDGTRANE